MASKKPDFPMNPKDPGDKGGKMSSKHIPTEELENYLFENLLSKIVGTFKVDKHVDLLSIVRPPTEDYIEITGIRKGKGNQQQVVFQTRFDIKIRSTQWKDIKEK